jgi:signal transduction histidine kinase
MTMPANSLRWRLVCRLVVLQAAMLTLLVVSVVAALWACGILISLEPEDETIDTLRDAIVRDANGALALRETPAMATLRADIPDFWFVARDRDGRTLSHGAVPPEYARIGGALDDIGQARLGWNLGDTGRYGARLKRVSAPAGEIHVLTGSGGHVSWQRVVFAISALVASVILPVLVVMALTTLIATPIVVRRALAGLGQAAKEAETIDIDQRGARLPAHAVPAEIVPLVSAINGALRRLDQGYERHERFLADAAHELRTPIAILQTRLESLALGPGAARVLEDVARLSTLADQLLDLQRVDQRIDAFSAVDLVAVGRRVVADLAPLAIAADYELSFETAADRIAVRGDEGSIERALTNLVQNAIQHGGRRGMIIVRVDRPATISVTDDGPGIPVSERERVFEPFFRPHGYGRGAGLGLNLVREITRLHGGHVAIHDGPSGGTCVELVFTPLAAAATPA